MRKNLKIYFKSSRFFLIIITYKKENNSFFRLCICTLIVCCTTSCRINNEIIGTIGSPSSSSPNVAFQSLTPTEAIGNSASIFQLQLSYENVEAVDLQASFLAMSYTGGVSCNLPTINSGTSQAPILTITGCTGDGTAKVLLNPGSGQNANGEEDEGAASGTLTVDNTAPVVTVGSPTPTSGDLTTTFSFPVTYSGDDIVNLTSGDITSNVTGSSCDAPIVSNGTSSTPTVTITNCIGIGTVGVTIAANTSSDQAGNQNLASATSVTATNSNFCPIGYIRVTADGSYTISDFCVMKYEAKLLYDTDGDNDFSNAIIVADGNTSATYNYDTDYETPANLIKYKAVSQVSGRPWVRNKRGENGAASGQGAIEACQLLNIQEDVSNKYDLITNAERQTIARDVAAQQSGATNNWGVDSNSHTVLNHGHADDSPTQSCDANNEYVQTDCANSGGETKYQEKRTHNLSNGEVIWDLAGNVWEWSKDPHTANAYTGDFANEYWAEWVDADFDGISDSYSVTQDLFGPLDLTPAICSDPGLGDYCGFGYLYDYNVGAVLRGGDWTGNAIAGIFSVYLRLGPSSVFPDIGFRCVYHP